MSERAELVKAIWSVETMDFGGYSQRDAEAVADNLLAAGYRKPRTITAAGELDALPVGSIVRTESYSIYVKDSIRGDEQRSWWVTVNEQFDFETKDIELPAIVLYEQEGPK